MLFWHGEEDGFTAYIVDKAESAPVELGQVKRQGVAERADNGLEVGTKLVVGEGVTTLLPGRNGAILVAKGGNFGWDDEILEGNLGDEDFVVFLAHIL